MTHLPNLNKLSEHAFIRNVLRDSVPFMKPNSKVTDYKLGSNERYIAEVGYYVGQILNQVERIDQAGILVNSYPRINAWRARYGRFEYFQYHLEQYFIAVAGLVDRLLLLVNQLYELGCNDEEVRYTNVVKKLGDRNQKDIVAILQIMRDSLKSIKLSKNRYTHSVRFWEQELWHIGLIEFSIKNNTIPDPEGYLKEDLKFDLQLFRAEKMELILKNEKALNEMITHLYTILDRAYSAKLAEHVKDHPSLPAQS